MQVLVTGGAGFIGSTLARRLLARGDEVRLLDDLSTGRLANLAGLEADIELVEGDLRRLEDVREAIRGVEVVFHHGALPSVPRSIEDPETTHAVNALGTLNMLVAAREEGVRRAVLASSSSVYGDSGSLPRTESATPDPISPYAASKLAAERHAADFSLSCPLETVTLRYFNVFGPNQDPGSQYAAVVPRFIAAVAAGHPVSIYGDGAQSRDFTYVADVVEANVLAAEAPGLRGELVNVAAGRSRTVNALAQAIGDVLDRPVRREYLPARPGEVRESWADIAHARSALGWEPGVSLEEGLRLTAEAVPAQA